METENSHCCECDLDLVCSCLVLVSLQSLNLNPKKSVCIELRKQAIVCSLKKTWNLLELECKFSLCPSSTMLGIHRCCHMLIPCVFMKG